MESKQPKLWAIVTLVVALIGAIAAIFAAMIKPQIELLPLITQISATASDESTDQNSIVAFEERFDEADGSYDTGNWICTSETCNAQNIFQQNGMLKIQYSGTDSWGGIMRSQHSWNMNKLVSLEGKLQIGSETRGGAWIGLDGEGWQGVEKGPDCAIVIHPDEAPVIGCNIGPDNNKQYQTADLPIRAETWYVVRIDYDPMDKELKYYLDDELIGRSLYQNSSEIVSVIIGAWREGDQLDVYVDDVIVKTKP